MDELEDNREEELMKRAISDDAADDAMCDAYRRSHVNLPRIRRKKLKFLAQLEIGGRERKSFVCHDMFHKRIIEDHFGIPMRALGEILTNQGREFLEEFQTLFYPSMRLHIGYLPGNIPSRMDWRNGWYR